MAYTPELSDENSASLRRIAWMLGKPMTFAMDWCFKEVTKSLDAKAICQACKDPSKCESCSFQRGRQ